MGRAVCRLILVTVLAIWGCRMGGDTRPYREPPKEGIKSTEIDYVDTTGFDVLFEASLVNQDPVIIVRTEHDKPDWTGRLNAWIAAWNMGGKVRPPVARGQIPLPTINGDTLREFRLLVNSLVDRADDAAKTTVSWWNEDRIRSRRVELLKPYNLRFHMGGEGRIQLIFFNGNYAKHYREFMSALTNAEEEEGWSRRFECSCCSRFREVLRSRQTQARQN
jgi:hypothetical protein